MSASEPCVWYASAPADLRIDDALDEWFAENEKHSRSFALPRERRPTCRLFLTATRGKRLITVPGAKERDFRFYGRPGTTVGSFASYVRDAVVDGEADHVEIPLLSQPAAVALAAELSALLPDFRFQANLASVVPLILKDAADFFESRSLRRAARLPARNGWDVRTLDTLPPEVETIHSATWGANRSATFFQMLSFLAAQSFSDVIGLFDRNGALISLQVNLRTSDTFHYYYSACVEAVAGAGSAVLGLSYEKFLCDARIRCFSFGRGGERYKYRQANRVREVFEVRGFYVPSSAPVSVGP